MKIDLNFWLPKLQAENFVVRESRIANETCYLVFPAHIGVEWNSSNLIFRSSIWNSQGELISAGFPKFVNWFERPDLYPTPNSLTFNCHAVTKIDGSTLIVSKYKGELIARTRGTFEATALNNGREIEQLKRKYPKAFDFGDTDTYNGSYLYEWVTPNNRIVIAYPEPDLHLIGHINHEDYSLTDQTTLDQMAIYLGSIKRPKKHHFDSVEDMLAKVELFENTEGVVVYYNKDQNMRKIKSADYLIRHRLKDHLRTLNNVIDFYFGHGCPDYQACYNAILQEVDFETAEECKNDLTKICETMREVKVIIQSMKDHVENYKHQSRKEFAQDAIKTWGQNVGCVFNLLDGKELQESQIKNLLKHFLKI